MLGVPKPEGHHPGSEKGREAATDGTGDGYTARRTQRVGAVRDLNQVRLGRGASQGRENGELRLEGTGSDPSYEGPHYFSSFSDRFLRNHLRKTSFRQCGASFYFQSRLP